MSQERAAIVAQKATFVTGTEKDLIKLCDWAIDRIDEMSAISGVDTFDPFVAVGGDKQ
jgi:hypothetical protein